MDFKIAITCLLLFTTLSVIYASNDASLNSNVKNNVNRNRVALLDLESQMSEKKNQSVDHNVIAKPSEAASKLVQHVDNMLKSDSIDLNVAFASSPDEDNLESANVKSGVARRYNTLIPYFEGKPIIFRHLQKIEKINEALLMKQQTYQNLTEQITLHPEKSKELSISVKQVEVDISKLRHQRKKHKRSITAARHMAIEFYSNRLKLASNGVKKLKEAMQNSVRKLPKLKVKLAASTNGYEKSTIQLRINALKRSQMHLGKSIARGKKMIRKQKYNLLAAKVKPGNEDRYTKTIMKLKAESHHRALKASSKQHAQQVVSKMKELNNETDKFKKQLATANEQQRKVLKQKLKHLHEHETKLMHKYSRNLNETSSKSHSLKTLRSRLHALHQHIHTYKKVSSNNATNHKYLSKKRLKHLKKVLVKLEKTLNSLQLQQIVYNAQIKHAKQYPHTNPQTVQKEIAELQSKMHLVKAKLAKTKFSINEYSTSLLKAKRYSLPSIKKDANLIKSIEHHSKLLQKSMKHLIKLNIKKKLLVQKQKHWKTQLKINLKNGTNTNQIIISTLKVHISNSKKKLIDINKQITKEKIHQKYLNSLLNKREKHIIHVNHKSKHSKTKQWKSPTYYPDSKHELNKLLVTALKHQKKLQFELSTEMKTSKRKSLKDRIKKLKAYVATVRQEIQFHSLLVGTHSSRHTLKRTLHILEAKLKVEQLKLKEARSHLHKIQKKLNNPDLKLNIRTVMNSKKLATKKLIKNLEMTVNKEQTKIKLIKNRLYQFHHFSNWHSAHFVKKRITNVKTHLKRTQQKLHRVEVNIAALYRQLKSTTDSAHKALIKHKILELQKHHTQLRTHHVKYQQQLHMYKKSLHSHKLNISHKVLKSLKKHHHHQITSLKSKLEKVKQMLHNTPHLLSNSHKQQLNKQMKKLKHLIEHHKHSLKKVNHKLLKHLLNKTKAHHSRTTHEVHKHAFKVEHLSHKLTHVESKLEVLKTQLAQAKTKKWKEHLQTKIKSMSTKKQMLKLSIHHHKKKLHHFASKLKQLHIKLNAKKHHKWKKIKKYHKKKADKHKHKIHKIKNHIKKLKHAMTNAKTIEWKLHLLHKLKKAKHKLKHHEKKLKHHLNIHKHAHQKLETLKVHPIVKVLRNAEQHKINAKRKLKHKIKLERTRKHKHLKKLSNLVISENKKKHNQLKQIKAVHKAKLGGKLKRLHSQLRKNLKLRQQYLQHISKLEEQMHSNIFKLKKTHHTKTSKLRRLLLKNLKKLKTDHTFAVKKLNDKTSTIQSELAAQLHALSITWMKFQHTLATKKLKEMPVKATLTDKAKPLAIKAYKTKLAASKAKKLLEINKAKQSARLQASNKIAVITKNKLQLEKQYAINEKLLRKRFHEQLDTNRNRNTLTVKAQIKSIKSKFKQRINIIKQKISTLKLESKKAGDAVKVVLAANKQNEIVEKKQKKSAHKRLKQIKQMKIKHQHHVKERLAKKLTTVKTKLFLGNGRPQLNPIPMKKNSKIPSSIGGYSLTFKAKLDKDVLNKWAAILKRGTNKTQRNPAIYVKPKTHTMVFQSHKTVMHHKFAPLEWNNIAIVRDRKHFSLYINGTLVKSKSILDSKVHGIGPIYFGSPNKPPALVTLNNVTYFNYPLTDIEIGKTTVHKFNGGAGSNHHSNWLKTLLQRKKACKSNKHCRSTCQGVSSCIATCLKQRNDNCKRYLSLHRSLLKQSSIQCAKHISKSACILYKRLLHMQQAEQKNRASKRYNRLKKLKQQLKHKLNNGRSSSATCRKRIGKICLKRIHIHVLNHQVKAAHHHHKLLQHKAAHVRSDLKYKFLLLRSQYWNAKWRQSKVHWAKVNAQYTEIISEVGKLKAKLTVVNHLIGSTADSVKKAALQKQQQNITTKITKFESKKSKLTSQVSKLAKERAYNKKRYSTYVKLTSTAKQTALANKKAAMYHSQQLRKHQKLYKKSLLKVVNHFKARFKKHMMYKGSSSWLNLKRHDVHVCVAAIKATRQTKTSLGVSCRFTCQNYLKSFRQHHCLKVNKAGKSRKHSFHICMEAKKTEKATVSKKTCTHKCRVHAKKLRQKACLPWKILSSRSYRRLLFLKNKCEKSKVNSKKHVKFCSKYKLILGYKNQCVAVRRAGATASIQTKTCFKWVQFTNTLESGRTSRLVKRCIKSQKTALVRAQACVNGKCMLKYVGHLSKDCRLVKQKVNLLYARNECLLARHNAKEKRKLCKKTKKECLKEKLITVHNGCLKLAAITTILSRQFIALRRNFLQASRRNHHTRKQMLSCQKAKTKTKHSKNHHSTTHHSKKHHSKKHVSITSIHCSKIIKKHKKYRQQFLRSKRHFNKVKHLRKRCNHHSHTSKRKHKSKSTSCNAYYRWIYNRFRLK